MGIWSHLISALKGEDRKGGDSSSDVIALKLLDKEIRQSDARLKENRDALAEVLSIQKQAESRIAVRKERIAELEDDARQALNQGNEALARNLVESLMPLEAERQGEEALLQDYQQAVADIRQQIHQSELELKQLKQQTATLKATASVQKAQASVIGCSVHYPTAQEALARMKAKQAENAERLKAQKDLNDSARKNELLEKFKQAGIRTSSSKTQAVLDRLKGKE